MPSLDGGVVGHLKGVVDACIDGREAGLFDVHHRYEVLFAMCERPVDGGLFCTQEWQSVHDGVGIVQVNGSNVDCIWPWIDA